MLSKWFAIYVCALLCVLVWAGRAIAQTTYYVTKSGNDSNTCVQAQTVGTARLTIDEGRKCLSAGDTLEIGAGTYAEEMADTIPSGTSWSAPVTIKSIDGESVIIQPPGGSLRCFTFAGVDTEYIILDGFQCDGLNNSNDSIKVTDGARHFRFRNLELKNPDNNGILVGGGSQGNGYSTFVTITNVEVYGTGASGSHHGFYIASPDNVVEHSYVHDNDNWGMHIFNSGGGVNDNIVRYNYVVNNGANDGGGILVSSGARNLVHHNITRDNSTWGGIRISCDDCEAYDNTVENNSPYGILVQAVSDNSFVENNALINNTTNISDLGTGTTIEYNGCTTSGGCAGTNQTTLVSTTGVDFTNVGTHDFTLVAGSSAIAAGNDVGLNLCNGTCDLGAFETWGYLSGDLGSFNNRFMTLTFQGAFAPFLAPGGCTGWSQSGMSCAPTCQSVTPLGDDTIRIEWDCDAIAGESLSVIYAGTHVTDGIDIVGRNQPLHGFTGTVTNNVPFTVIYVDGALGATCSNNYDHTSPGVCAGGSETAYHIMANAVAAASPGVFVRVQPGTYTQTMVSPGDVFWDLTANGTSGSPITYEPVNYAASLNPTVKVECEDLTKHPSSQDTYCFEDLDLSPVDGDADGPDIANGILIRVSGNWNVVRGFEVYGSSDDGIVVIGNDNIVEHNEVRSNWQGGIAVIAGGDRNTFRYNELWGNRHFPGQRVEGSASLTDDNTFYRNYNHHNGFLDDMTTKVLPTSGDPTGGGNVDGMKIRNSCRLSAAPGTNWCNNTIVQENVFWRNPDGGIDNNGGDSLLLGNIDLESGFAGVGTICFKDLSDGSGRIFGTQYVRNVCYFNTDNGMTPSAPNVLMLNNTIVGARGKGVNPSSDALDGTYEEYNTLVTESTGRDWQPNCVGQTCSNMYIQDGDGPCCTADILGSPLNPDPQLTNSTIWQSGGTLVINPVGNNVEEIVQWFHNQIKAAFTPTSDSAPGVDAGLTPAQYTNPQTSQTVSRSCVDDCDIGAYEFMPTGTANLSIKGVTLKGIKIQ